MPTIEKLVKEDKAYTYPKKVFFQNGKVLEKNCDECDNNLGCGACTGNSKNGMVDTTGELKCFEKKNKKSKKDDYVPLEELPDETEGF